MGAGAVSGHKNSKENSSGSNSSNTPTREKPRREAGQASLTAPNSCAKPLPSTNMSCELCSVNFTFFKRKKYCVECQRYFCSTCLPKPPSSAPPGRQCSKCRLLLSGCFTRTDLQHYKVKDIRCFLKVKNISMAGCKEKHDLVELVLTHFCTQQGRNVAGRDETEHEILVRQMAAHMRNVSFVQEESQGSLGSGSSNTGNSVPEQIGGGNSQQSPPLATTTSNASASSATAATADSSGAGATSSSSSFSTAAPACASSSQPSAAPAAAEENSTNTAEQRNMGSSEGSSSGQDGERALEEDLEERINSLNTDRLRDLLEAMERLQETFAASQEEEDDAPPAPAIRRTQLEDVKSVEDVENLTVRQLKELLVNNFVDYRGCCERSELVDRVKALWIDHQENLAIAQEIQEEEEAEAASRSSKKAESDISKNSPIRGEGSSAVEVESTSAKQAAPDGEKASNIPQHSSSSLDSLDPGAQQKLVEDSPARSTSPQRMTLEATSGDAPQPDPSSPGRRTRNQHDSLCNICMDSLADCILLECGHMVTCTQCGKRLANCPICRQYISRVVRVFRS